MVAMGSEKIDLNGLINVEMGLVTYKLDTNNSNVIAFCLRSNSFLSNGPLSYIEPTLNRDHTT